MAHFTLVEIREAFRSAHKRVLSLPPSFAPAAVMVLVYPKDGECCILFNKRSEVVRDHKGEIAFPGGRVDDEDNSLLDTALRETYEEMGVRPSDVDVIGTLDDVATISDYMISPFVGTIPYPYPFNPSEREVAEVIEIPLSVLECDSTLRYEARVLRGKLFTRVGYAYQGHLVFGATAMIVDSFLKVLSN